MKTLDVLNNQIKNEFFSAYLYLAMSAYFSDEGLPGFANWTRVQAKEEVTHATKMYDYILSRGAKITLKAIEAPQATWKTPLDAMEAGLKHEKFITQCINEISSLAIKEKDHATQIFMQWFVNEQVEEEKNFTDIVHSLRLVKGDGRGLLMLDRELATRVFVDATLQPAAPVA